MHRSQFLVRDILSAKYIRYLSGLILFLFFCLTIMSFTNDGEVIKKNNNKNDSLSAKDFKSLFNSEENIPTERLVIALNPKVVSFAEKYISKEALEFENMKVWGKRYFDLFNKVFDEQNLPKELKYLSVIESHLRPGSGSSAGALGPWQLMKSEAKRYGLKSGKGVDERRDFAKSTQVAAKLLKGLYNEFGDWLLVLAAYNAGEGRVKQAIKKAGSDNFWDLQYYLPAETRNHVKKYIATHYFFEGNGGLTTMTADETTVYNAALAAAAKQLILSEEELKNILMIDVSGKYNGAVISRNIAMDLKEFNRFNPGFDKRLAEGQTYQLRLPKDKFSVFKDKKQLILQESVQLLLAAPGMLTTVKS